VAAGIRVHQLAKELGIESKEIVARCQRNGLGTSVRGAQSMLTGDVLIAVRSWFQSTATTKNRLSTVSPSEADHSTAIEPYEVSGGGVTESMSGDIYDLVQDRVQEQAMTAVPLELLLAELATVRAIVEEQLVPAVADLQKLKEAEAGASESLEVTSALATVEEAELAAVAVACEETAQELTAAIETVLEAETVAAEPMPGIVEGVGVPATTAIETAEEPVPQAQLDVSQVMADAETVAGGGEVKVVAESQAIAEAPVQQSTVEEKQTVMVPVKSEESSKAPESKTITVTPTPEADVPVGPVAQVRPVVDVAVSAVEKKKGLLPRIRLGASLGIYLSEDKLVWSLAEKFPLGQRIAETFEQPITRTEWAAGVASVLEKYLVGRAKKSMRVVIGLPASQIFFATLPQSSKGEKAEALLTSNNCCSSIPTTDLCCGLVSLKVMGKSFASIGAARRRDIAALTEVGRKAGNTMIRVEPAPWALLRLGSSGKVPNKTVIRLFVNGTELVAVLAQGAHPLLWRGIELSTSGAEAADSILSMVRTFETYAQQHVGLEEISSITLQGENVPERLAERLQAELGAKFSPIVGPGPTALAISKGLAMGGLEWEKPALDLASSLAPPPQLKNLIPYGELAMMASLVVCSGLWLWSAGNEAQARAKHAEDSNLKNVVLKTEDPKLQQEKTMLSSEVQSVTKFMSNRVLWTEYLNQLSARIPPNVNCLQMQGDYEMSTGTEKNEKKLKRSFQVDFTANLAKDVSAPPEVDHVLASLRQSPVITRDFPEMKLASLRVNKTQQRGGDGTDPAIFKVSCMPKPKPAAAAPAPGTGGEPAKP
jgi:hypothetical protein